jgi:predicted lipid-binding transport protein (Tim44 family)
MSTPSEPENRPAAEPRIIVKAWHTAILGAAAGGLGWGIRGQYGHETGAMIAGLLVSLTLVLLLARHAPPLTAARRRLVHHRHRLRDR